MPAASLERDRTIPLWAKALLLFMGYIAAAELGNLLSVQHAFSTLWPPAGLFIAILLISERRGWPALIAAAVVGNVCSDLLHGRALVATLGFSAANVLEALAAATLVSRLTGSRPRLRSLREVLAFAAVGAVLAPVIGAVVGTIAVVATTADAPWWTTWYTWWIADVCGIVIIGSVVLTGVGQWDQYRANPKAGWGPILRPLGHALLVAIPFSVIAYLVFGPMGGGTSWKFLVMPGIITCGIVGGPLGAAVGLLLVTVGGVAGMAAGVPLSGLAASVVATRVLQAQAFFVVGGVATLALAGVIAENRAYAEDAFESAERFRALFDTMSEGVAYCRMIFDDAGEPVDWVYLQVNKAFAQVAGVDDVTGRHVWEIFPRIDEENPELFTIYGKVASTGEPVLFESARAATGRVLRVSVTSPVRGDFVAVMQDVTERVAGEEALEQSSRRLERMVYDVAEAMGSVVEAKDPYTQGHEVRVALLARRIAREMNLSETELDEINMAGLLHDIGKLRVPAEILTKPGQLSAAEFRLIQDHPAQGREILQHIDFPWRVADIVLQHHERLDGTGYPAGLRGDEIMLPARILAVADVVEAMASHRPYRPAVGLEAAIEEIAAHPERYDGSVVRACIRLYERGETGL